MDRTLVLTAPVAIARGHRVEVTEHVDRVTAGQVIFAVVDLDTGIRYQLADATPDEALDEVTRWNGRVLECTVMQDPTGVHTTLKVDPLRPAVSAKEALLGADAAAGAAKAEADRWGGADRHPSKEHERFW